MLTYISPKELYPMQDLSSIKEERIQFYLKCFIDNIQIETVKVILFDKNYYILEGHHRVLAANRLKLTEIGVEVIKTETVRLFEEKGNLIHTLAVLGMSTLYDFETVGDFLYKEYPIYYR